MQTRLLDGKTLAAALRREVAETIKRDGLTPGLGAILVGDDPASELYVLMKEKACAEAGIRFVMQHLPASAAQWQVVSAITTFADDPAIHCILLQLPLPSGLNEGSAIAAIPITKDVDSFREGSPVASPLIQAILTLVETAAPEMVRPDQNGRTAAVFAHNNIFKKRLLERLLSLGFADAQDAPADLAVVALGQPASFGRDRVKENGVVIDVGTTRIGGKTVGDADAASLDGYLSARSPVPGGIGPLTIAYLLKNVVELCRRANGTS